MEKKALHTRCLLNPILHVFAAPHAISLPLIKVAPLKQFNLFDWLRSRADHSGENTYLRPRKKKKEVHCCHRKKCTSLQGNLFLFGEVMKVLGGGDGTAR